MTEAAFALVPTRVKWSGETPRGYRLEVERRPDGRWSVVMGGFSRAFDPRLRVALAEACGERKDSEWIRALARELERAAAGQ